MTPRTFPEQERRVCERFEIPGATLSYKKRKVLGMERAFSETGCPLIEISYNGARFLNHKALEAHQELLVEILSPGDASPLSLKGRVSWCEAWEGKGYDFQTGIHFLPYGRKKGENDPRKLTRIKKWAEQYVNVAET